MTSLKCLEIYKEVLESDEEEALLLTRFLLEEFLKEAPFLKTELILNSVAMILASKKTHLDGVLKNLCVELSNLAEKFDSRIDDEIEKQMRENILKLVPFNEQKYLQDPNLNHDDLVEFCDDIFDKEDAKFAGKELKEIIDAQVEVFKYLYEGASEEDIKEFINEKTED